MNVNNSISSLPRDVKLVQNTKYIEKKVTAKKGQSQGGDVANHIQNMESLVHVCAFLHQVLHSKGKAAAVMLMTNEQLMDLRRFCCSYPAGQTTVLGFDKTFNLTCAHVTVGVYKNLSVFRKGTEDHPIFIGPIFLHGNSDFETYGSFFGFLSMKLRHGECR